MAPVRSPVVLQAFNTSQNISALNCGCVTLQQKVIKKGQNLVMIIKSRQACPTEIDLIKMWYWNNWSFLY